MKNTIETKAPASGACRVCGLIRGNGELVEADLCVACLETVIALSSKEAEFLQTTLRGILDRANGKSLAPPTEMDVFFAGFITGRLIANTIKD